MATTVYAPLGMLGYGFPEESLNAAVAKGPDAIVVDAGSTDPGPYYLGAGLSYTSRRMVKRDLSLILPAARRLDIPLIIGSAGGAGGKPHLEWTLEIVRELAAEKGLRFRLAAINAEIPKETIRQAIRDNSLVDFEVGRAATIADVDSCTRVVAQMGVEPIISALQQGAEVVVAGRAYDAALAAAVPLMRGGDPGLSFHMGKIVECGSLVALPRTSDGVLARVEGNSFVIEPADPNKYCTVELVAAHTLYEKSDPYHLAMPGGEIDLRRATFTQEDPRTVRVAGSDLNRKPYAVKLEGAALVGFRAICVAGARDPVFIARVDEVIERVRAKIGVDLQGLVDPGAYSLRFRIYGRDGVMGEWEPAGHEVGHEIGLIIDVVASSQDIADTVCALARSAALHMGYQGRIASAGNLAFPYSPAEFAAPPAYEFRIYHLLPVEDPLEPFPIEWEDVGGAT